MRRAAFLLLGLLLLGCGDPRVGDRYRAQRELWRADRQREELPTVAAGHAGLGSLAVRYERIGRRYEQVSIADSLAAEIHTLAGRALLHAVDTHLARVDSLRAEELLEEMQEAFGILPELRAEIAWRQGRVAEIQGNRETAISSFRIAVESVAPDPGAEGIADSVLNLPVRMVRLSRSRSDEGRAAELASWARDYCRAHLEADSLDVRLEASRQLAEVEFETGRWSEAMEELSRLEQEVLPRQPARFEPAEVRLRRFEARVQAWLESQEGVDALRPDFAALSQDYPEHGAVPTALWVMARAARDRGFTEEALRLLSRLRLRYSRSAVAPRAMLARARLYERQGDWREAYVEYRLLETEHPLSGAGLRVPLEIALHHQRQNDELARDQALERAVGRYREILVRYPPGPHDTLTRELLVESLRRLGRFETALGETLELSRRVAPRPLELEFLVRAVRIAREDLGDPGGARPILERIVQEYPGTRLGQRAERELAREGAGGGGG